MWEVIDALIKPGVVSVAAANANDLFFRSSHLPRRDRIHERPHSPRNKMPCSLSEEMFGKTKSG